MLAYSKLNIMAEMQKSVYSVGTYLIEGSIHEVACLWRKEMIYITMYIFNSAHSATGP